MDQNRKGNPMLYGKYQFLCRFEKAAILPPYKGSTFRGVFGIALKNVVCALKRLDCKDCVLRQRCLYTLVFETPIALENPRNARVSVPPHPFVIEPPATERIDFVWGDPITCELLLFGDYNRNLPYFVYAFEQMGKIGIGKRTNGTRGRFVLEEVREGKRVLYSAKDRKMLQAEAKVLDLPENSRESEDPALEDTETNGHSRITITLETPLRLKSENRIRADLPFHILTRAMLRRMSSLLEVYGPGEPAIDYKGLVERSGQVRTVENRLSWFDWKRYSNRQDRKMFMGGMVGSVTYEGDLKEFLPLIDFAEKVHLGKNTSFGLGKIEVRSAG